MSAAEAVVSRFDGRVAHLGVAIVTQTGALDVAWTPASADEPANLAYSITKTFSAALLLRWQDEGLVGLDTPIAAWAPEVPAADRISIRRLLNHTAGIPDYGHLPQYHEAVRTSPSAPWSFERFAAETYEQGLWFEPGAGWGYSNPGYMLLARIAETIGGAPYRALIADRVARPIGLTRTFVPETIADLASLAPAASRLVTADGAPADVRDRYHPGWVSHKVVASTPSDVARFFAALFAGRLVSRSALHEMTTLVHVPDAPPGGAYGLGLMGSLPPARSRFGHNGGGPGYGASAWHAPDLGVSVCAMGAFEGTGVDPEAIVNAALDRLGSR